MNIPKHVAGLVLFIFIVSLSVFVVEIVNAPLEMIPPLKQTPPLRSTVIRDEAPSVDYPVHYKVRLVSLDFINRESYTTLTLRRDRSFPAPDRVRVSTSFYTLERPLKSWAGTPAEIRRPFANGDEITVTLKDACPVCSDASAPRAGYYARVLVSTGWSDSYRDYQTDAPSQKPISVLVQAEQTPRR